MCQRVGEMYLFRKFVNWFKILNRRFARSEYLSIKTAARSHIQIAQLHGQEDEAYIKKLKSLTDHPVMKAFSIQEKKDLDVAAASSADLILLDHGKGGTGETFDWSLLEGWTKRPYFLAGGLNPENIPEAIQRIHPWGIDLSSAVETDGKKDREKILQAVKTVRNFESSKHFLKNKIIYK